MPLVRIDLAEGTSGQFRRTLGDIVYKAMIDIIDVPADDKFQIITEHRAKEFNYSSSNRASEPSTDLVFIQITLTVGRTVQAKQAFYKEIAEQLHAQLGIRRGDVFINLVETAKENWSFGNGIAQYVV